MFQERGSSGKASKTEASADLQARLDALIIRRWRAVHSVITRATGEMPRRRYTKVRDQKQLQWAMDAVVQGVMSLRSAERTFNIPRTTLQRYIKQGIPSFQFKKMEYDFH
ncbi:hypothetical protein KQX54_003842 [Cotesia glomerata]|uniref:HTH psq-type domain-containing protein n=1 Tax=Cotesia glomerata TaxID=32391 RepID=A0AAV7IIV4_COTGL|nr:hypothetical protein KQX54_003842 [Cotesia glomerata]